MIGSGSGPDVMNTSLRSWLLTFAALLFAASCAHAPLNQPLLGSVSGRVELRSSLPRALNSDELLLVVTLSGGGTRAAAFAYGVLEQLASTEVASSGMTHRLLDEVDVISAVSGGSFVAAYYGLFGDRIFADFDDRFLKRDIEAALEWRMMSPLNWWRLSSANFGRTDLAAELYDDTIFDHASFAALARRPGPLIVINGTDLTLGANFSFTQDQFDWLCSDLSSYQVARAVATSSSVPLVFSPLTLANYAGTCNFHPPFWFRAALDQAGQNTHIHTLAAQAATYLDRDRRPYVHLVDGGVADNLGLRAAVDRLLIGQAVEEAVPAALAHARKVAFIVVNATLEPDFRWDTREEPPPARQIIEATAAAIINRYDYETKNQARRNLQILAQRLLASRCAQTPGTPQSAAPTTACDPIEVYFIPVGFDTIDDPVERVELQRVRTTLALDGDTVDRLRRVSARALARSAEFQRLVRDLQ